MSKRRFKRPRRQFRGAESGAEWKRAYKPRFQKFRPRLLRKRQDWSNNRDALRRGVSWSLSSGVRSEIPGEIEFEDVLGRFEAVAELQWP